MNVIKSYIVTNAAASSGSGGGTGTVTSFSAGNLSPLFISLVATATTTPALTFAAVNQNANLFYAGPSAGIAAAPTFRALVAADLPYVFSNGLTRTGNDVKLGGVLAAGNTLIDGDGALGASIQFGNSGTELSSFATFAGTNRLSTTAGAEYFQTTNFGYFSGVHRFNSSEFTLANPALTFSYIFNTAAIVASRTITLPLLTGNDVMVTAAFTQTLTNKTFGNTTLFANNTGIDVVTTGGSDILNIGTSNADVINIGYSGSTINITGTLAYQNVTNLQVTDKLFTVNKGGGVGSGVSSGFEIEENAVITGYFATNGTRDGWDFKAPAITGVANLSLASLTGNRTYTLPDAAGTFAVSASGNIALSGAGDITFTGVLGAANGGTGIANNAASTLTISGNFATTFTVTAGTGVTLPTTGTLATLAGAESLTNKTLGSGTVFSVIPTIDDGITFTFNPSATVAGLNVGGLAGNPSSLNNGDIWYNSTSGAYGIRSSGTTSPLIHINTSSTSAQIPFFNSTIGRVAGSANFTFVTNRILGTTLYLTLSAGTATAGTGPLIFTSSGTGLTGLLTVAVAGVMEFTTYGLWVTTTTPTRHKVWHGLVGVAAPATNNIGVILDYYGTSSTRVLTTPNTWISVVGDDGNVYKLPAYS